MKPDGTLTSSASAAERYASEDHSGSRMAHMPTKSSMEEPTPWMST